MGIVRLSVRIAALAIAVSIGFAGCESGRVRSEIDAITGNEYIYLPLRNSSPARPVLIQTVVESNAPMSIAGGACEMRFVKIGRDSIPTAPVYFVVDGDTVQLEGRGDVLAEQRRRGPRVGGYVSSSGAFFGGEESLYEEVEVTLTAELVRKIARAKVVSGRIGPPILGKRRGFDDNGMPLLPPNEFLFQDFAGPDGYHLQGQLQKFVDYLDARAAPTAGGTENTPR